MDPARNLIHLGLKLTETGLDRALGIVRLADTLLAASAVPTSSTEERRWPEEEQGDLEALSRTLRAKGDQPTETAAQGESSTAAPRKSAATKQPASKTAARKARAKKSTAKKTTAKRATAKKAPAARKSPTKKTAAKKSTAKKTAKKQAPDA